MSAEPWETDGTLAKAEYDAIIHALEVTSYNVSDAARRLQIGRSTLYRLVHKFGLELPSDRPPPLLAREPASPPADRGQKDKIVQIDGNWFMVQQG